MIGTTILHFQILEKIGEGGMGVVYKARDTHLDRLVALKFLPPHVADTAEERARFALEAKAAATLNHPHVCTIYGIEDHEGQQFIEMEYVEGTTLRARIGPSGLPAQEALVFSLQIGEALREAHGRGIVHRDIKSENILVTAKAQVKVMDFGLAKFKGSSHLTKTSSTVGTLAYMAPEQIQGAEVDARSDIFSFGVVLFEMLTGRHPFRGEHDAAMMYSILNEDPVELTSVRPDLDPEIGRIIQRALEKDPEDRYQHVDDMVSELRRLQKKSSRVTRPLPTEGPSTSGSAAQRAGTTGPVPSPVREPGTPLPGKRRRPLVIGTAAVALLGALTAAYFLLVSPRESVRSMAVLPFANQSGDPELEFLSDGFTETLINRLSRLPGVRMMSRSSAFRYKGSDVDPAEAGAAMGVEAVLAGRILRRGDRIAVGVELVDVQDHSHIWGEQYQRSASDLLALQDEITREISQQLRVTLSGEDEEVLSRGPTGNTEAYELYLKGRFHWNKRSREGFESAVSYFNQAIEQDPRFALAYVGLADAYSVMSVYFMLPPAEAFARSRAAAQKALELDPSLAEAHLIMAVTLSEYEWQWEKGEESYKKAIALNPNYATAHQWYGESLAAMGRIDEAIAELHMAQQLDPLSPIIATSLGTAYAWLSRFDDAQRELSKALEMDPAFPRALWTRGVVRYLRGDTTAAINDMRGLLASTTENDDAHSTLAFLLGRSGNIREAADLTRQLHQKAKSRYVSPYLLAVCYAGMGDRNEAFRWLEKGFEERSSGIVYMRGDPLLGPLHGDPRFNKMLVAMGLKPEER
jgi:serine/threonine-protein kinase